MAQSSAAEEVEAPLLSSSPATVPAAPRRNTFSLVCAMLVSMTTILMGYNLALMSGAELLMREDLGLTDEQVEVLSGSMNVFMLASILAAGCATPVFTHIDLALMSARGAVHPGGAGPLRRAGRGPRGIHQRVHARVHPRRRLVANAFLMAGALAMSLDGNFTELTAARFVTSIGCGFSRVVVPVYNAEISPASMRGVLTSLLDIFINVGILLACVSNYAFAGMPSRLGWRVMYAAGAAMAMPESPRWLVLARTSDASSLADDDADRRLDKIKKQAVAKTTTSSPASGGGAWRELLLNPSASVRRVVVVVVGLQFFHHASGMEAVVLYSPLIFNRAGMASTAAILGATVAVGIVKTCFILDATLLSNRVGRRPLLLFSTAVTLTSIAIALSIRAMSAAVTISVLTFVAALVLGGAGPAQVDVVMPLWLRGDCHEPTVNEKQSGGTVRQAAEYGGMSEDLV
ncbi:hypothetical protein QOZ80_9BG0715240 [Eleusine coracana subsp. coracana]|nr:hypothetical protein QOZ80_9BG0715240 [Eleusine coracana subsp. coracana]